MMSKVKRIMAAILVLCLLICGYPVSITAEVIDDNEKLDIANVDVWSGRISNGFAAGDGTLSDPYVISNGEELKYFANKVTNGDSFLNKYIVLSNDIYLNDASYFDTWSNDVCPDNNWQPIGGAFAGTLDGGGHSIVGLYIKSDGENVGFFSQMSTTNAPTVQDLSFKRAYVSGKRYTGIVVGHAIYLNCTNVKVEGVVKGTYGVGGIVGGYFGLLSPNMVAGPINLISCTNYANVTGTDDYTGGLIGYASNRNLPNNDKIVITGCHNKGNITGTYGVGGLCGYLSSETDSQGAQISDSSNEGKIVSNNYAGGLFGYINDDDKAFSVSRVCNYGEVIANLSYAGGIAGGMCACFSTSSMNDLYNAGTISANTAAGGLAGRGATGTLGYIDIVNFYNIGKISALSKSFAGVGEASISGWFGHEAIRLNNAYYDKALGSNAPSITETNVVGLNSEQFKNAGNFKGFDFDNVWRMASYGPVFLWQASDQKCGENAYWSVSGDLDDLTLSIHGFGDTYDYDVNELSPWHYKYKIKHVVIGDEITSIGSYLFAFDFNIESIKLGKSIDKIKKDAFLSCEKLNSLNIPEAVSYIGDWCFSLSGLERIEFEGNAPQMFDCTFYDLTIEAKYDTETDGWEETQKKSYGGNIVWVDIYGTFKPNYVKLSYDLLDRSLPGIPSKDREQYINELFSWAVEYGYDDVLTKDKCAQIIGEKMPSVVAQDEYGTYVSYAYTTASMMRDILMINATKKSLTKWEKNDIVNAGAIELSEVHQDVNKIINKYHDYEKDAQRSALSSTFYTIYSSELLKTACGVVATITKDFFLGDAKEDFVNSDFRALYEDFFNREISLSNMDLQLEGIKGELAEQIKDEFPKKFTEKACKEFIGKVIEQNDDVNSFVEVYKEISNYTDSFKSDSIIVQFGSRVVFQIQLLQIYKDLMEEIDQINQGKYFMLQYSLMRYYPDLYDQIIDKDGNVIDLIDSYLIGIDSAFVREQIDNWYNNGGSSTQLSDKQKVTITNTAALVRELQNADPISMKKKLVEYWYEHEKNNTLQQSSKVQSEIILTADSEFHIQDVNGDLVGTYKDMSFQQENAKAKLFAVGNGKAVIDSNDVDENSASEVLYSDDSILVELGVTRTYVHVLFTHNEYKCVIDRAEGDLILSDITEEDTKSYKYSALDAQSEILIDEDSSVVMKNGEVVPDDSQKQTNGNQGANNGTSEPNGGSGGNSGTNTGTESNGNINNETEEENPEINKSSNVDDDIARDDNNGKVEKGETDATGTYCAISKTEAAYAPTKAVNKKKVVIADTVKIDGVEVKVTTIYKNALKNNKIVEKVVIGKNVKKIGQNAFMGATRLQAVVFKGQSIRQIGSNAFRNAKNLKTFDLSKQKSLIVIDTNAFMDCKKLNIFKIAALKLKTIGKDAFKTSGKPMNITIIAKEKKSYNAIVKKIRKAGGQKDIFFSCTIEG